MTKALGKGAGALWPSCWTNLTRPFIHRISDALAVVSIHHRVSVRAGTRHTTVTPASADSAALRMKAPIFRPYGGFIQQTPVHSCFKALSASVKNLGSL